MSELVNRKFIECLEEYRKTLSSKTRMNIIENSQKQKTKAETYPYYDELQHNFNRVYKIWSNLTDLLSIINKHELKEEWIMINEACREFACIHKELMEEIDIVMDKYKPVHIAYDDCMCDDCEIIE